MTGRTRTPGVAAGRAGLATLAGGCVLAATIALALLTAGPALGGKAPLTVQVDGVNASIDTFQALNSIDEVQRDKFDSDFARFSEALSPETLSGVEGTADAFVSQGSTVVTPSFTPPFEAEGIAVSGRLRLEAHKDSNGAAGVPVAFADGSFSASFGSESSADPVPIELAGYIRAANTDADECTEVNVEYDDGSSVQSFAVAAGQDCPPGLNRQKSFQVNQTLPAGGEYGIDVEYGSTVSAEDPGSTESANGAVEMTLSFYPPDTRITSAKVSAGRGKASFKFKASGNAKRLECALVRKGKKPRFRKCRSPKSYRHLKPGRYTFQARAVGSVAPEATPAKKAFRIR